MILSLGSHGDEVRQVEQRLKDLRLYSGGIDGVFGGGVQSAVMSFQAANGLAKDGSIGLRTWAALFPGSQPPNEPVLAAEGITQRCLALTGAFETSTGVPDCYGGLTGDFDGQGLSFGVLQWNIGQGTLQPLLNELIAENPDEAAEIFQNSLAALKDMLAQDRQQQLAWARSIQDSIRFSVFEPWKGFFQALGRTPQFQGIEVRHAENIRQKAEALCQQFGLKTERAVALMFDICVQNGSIAAETGALIRTDFEQIAAGSSEDVEIARLRSIANRRAEAAAAKYIEDVRARKLTIANGTGIVHNIPYNLQEQFGIGLQPF